MTMRRLSVAASLGAALMLAGCSDETLNLPPTGMYTGGPLFQRYVAMGNSITSGVQSAGILDSTQAVAYPVIVAKQMGGSPFYMPILKRPGCPAPFTNVFTQTRLGGFGPTDCAYRDTSSTRSPYISDVAVPGAEAIDVTVNGPAPGTNSNALTQLILGGYTQLQAMQAQHPTFVSVWIGNNDVLGAFTNLPNAGDSTLITPLATFQTDYQKIVDGINAVGARAILLGVAKVTDIPYASLGSIYFAIKAGLVPGAAFPPSFVVGPNCAPTGFGGKGDSILVPFPFGGALLAAAAGGAADTLYCTEPQTVQPAEVRKLLTTVAQYNAIISAAASANNWAYLDPNPVLDSLRADTSAVAAFPKFQYTSCSPSPFGTAFSCDGVHPSTSTQLLIARHIVQAINSKYGSAIPAP
jgi:lysophospholipase L1-like esterase